MNNRNTMKLHLVWLLVGAFLGLIIAIWILNSGYFTKLSASLEQNDSVTHQKSDEPLYWVAPMDPNYRRDKPGKSPMGMDLIPVYEKAHEAKPQSPETVYLTQQVINQLSVQISPVRKGKLKPIIKSVGFVQYDEEKLIHIHPRVDGWIEKLYVKSQGARVEKNQPLYEIYSPTLVSAQEEYLIALEQSNRRLITAAENRLAALALSETLIAKIKQQRKIQQRVTVFSPQSGIIDNLNIREGYFVKPDKTLMSIVSLSEVWVEAEVFAQQAFYLQDHLPVVITLDYAPTKKWHGKIDYVYPTINPQSRTVKVRIRLINSTGELKPDMFANVNIYPEPTSENLLVPHSALIQSAHGNRVIVALGGGYFKPKVVEVGEFDDKYIAINQGLEEGEKVVTSAQFLIDSESNKQAAFSRMSEHEFNDEEPNSEESNREIPTATVKGKINQMDNSQRLFNITREAIPQWDRASATMDFWVDTHIDIMSFQPGNIVEFTFEINNGEFKIIKITTLSNSTLLNLEEDFKL
ncbi:efflux RND transporter periplasmic adaptor subunit [Aliikangiella maris]|uniref:Efflux RND transporter periplasmic adaptor subunit n=2 Tax=Aliikangiella maris TaxID=3162458 RepID=A0ABV2BY24_9GAMM